MSTPFKPVLIKALSADERREVVFAARPLTKLQLGAAVAAKGVIYQNFTVWCNGANNRLSEDKQKLMLSAFGISPYGQLLPEFTHNWLALDKDNIDQMRTLLSYETNMQNAVIRYAYTSVDQNSVLLGAEINWKSSFGPEGESRLRGRRLIVTAVAGMWEQETFKAAIQKLFANRSAASDLKVHDKKFDFVVSSGAALNVWRWTTRNRHLVGAVGAAPSKRNPAARTGSRPRSSLLPLDVDVVGEILTSETARDLLLDIAPRFRTIVESTAKEKNKSVAPYDRSLIRRAGDVLGEISK